MTAKIDVVIVTYNSSKDIGNCLTSLAGVAVNVIVVDNASTDGTPELISQNHPWVHLIAQNVNKGFSHGCNTGIEAGQAPFVLLLNPDAILVRDNLRELVDFMDCSPSAGLVAPKLIDTDGETQESRRTYPTPLLILSRRTPIGRTRLGRHLLQTHLMSGIPVTSPSEVDWVIGACMLLRRQALDEIGYLDERFFLYFEDVDLCYRLWAAGWSVNYYPQVTVVHHYSRASAKAKPWEHLARLHLTSAMKFFLKHPKLILGGSRPNGRRHVQVSHFETTQ